MRRGLTITLILIAVLARVGWELSTTRGDGPVPLLSTHLIGDERAYDELARDFAADTVDRERAFYQEPLYAWLLGGLYELWPPDPANADLPSIPHGPVHRGVIWIQHALGVLIALAVCRLGRRVAGPGPGFLAGLFAALSGPLIFHESQLLKATLGLLVFVLALDAWLTVLEGRGGARAAWLGALLGVGVMLRGNLYLLAAAAVASLLLPWGTDRRRPRDALLVVLTAALCVSPLALANWSRGELVLTTYQAATNVAIGQPDDADPTNGVIYTPLRAGRGDARYEEQDAVGIAEDALGRRLSGPEVASWWWAEAGRRISDRPGVALQRVLWKLLHLVHGFEVPDVKDYNFLRRSARWLATPLSDLSWLGAWGLLAALLLPWRGRRELFVLRVGLATVAVTLALFYVMGRYRLTAAPCLWIFAAMGLHQLVTRWRELRTRARVALIAAGLGAPLLLGSISMPSDPNGDHVNYANAASVARGLATSTSDPIEAIRRRNQAVEWAQAAIDIAPAFSSPRVQLVTALHLSTDVLASRASEAGPPAWRLLVLMEGLRTGIDVLAELSGSVTQTRAVAQDLAARPSRPGGEAFTGPVLALALAWASRELEPGDPEAVNMLTRSLRLKPDDEVVLAERGRRLRRLKRPTEAAADYRRAIELGLDSFELRNNLANALRDLRRWDAALAEYDRALAFSPGHPGVLANRDRALQLAAEDATTDP